MSMYGLLNGVNINFDIILKLIDLDYKKIERFRDCGIDYEENQIWIYTRTGGANRETYKNEILTKNKYYLNDKDDNYNNTYAEYNFKVPDQFKDIIYKFEKFNQDRVNWNKIFERLKMKYD